MIITKTRTIEMQFIEIYIKSKNEDFIVAESISARELIFQFRSIIRLIDIVEETDHARNIDKLYFSLKTTRGYCITRIANELFLCERTLQRYRKKYAKVMEILLQYNKVEVLQDKLCPVTV